MTILGPKSDEILADIGLVTLAEVEGLGVEETFRRAKLAYPEITLNFLWGLEAALTGTDWREIPEPRKRELRRALSDVLGGSS